MTIELAKLEPNDLQRLTLKEIAEASAEVEQLLLQTNDFMRTDYQNEIYNQLGMHNDQSPLLAAYELAQKLTRKAEALYQSFNK